MSKNKLSILKQIENVMNSVITISDSNLLTIKCKDYIITENTITKRIGEYFMLSIDQFGLKPHLYRITCDILNNLQIDNKYIKELSIYDANNRDRSYSEITNKYISSIQLEIFSQSTGQKLYAQYPTFFYFHFLKNEDYKGN